MIKPRKLAVLMQRHADLVSTTRYDPARPTCFVCYHDADYSEVEAFVRQFGAEFVPRCVGVTPDDAYVGSIDDSYVLSCIRREVLADSTITILLLGAETWHQRFVDWELAASLGADVERGRNGVLVMPLPSLGNRATLPERVRDNFDGAEDPSSAVLYEAYPRSAESFRDKLRRAEASRLDAARAVNNARPLRRTDAP